MLERLRNQIGTAGLVVAIVALIAALGGGAYAATGGSGGGKATASAKQGKQGKQGKTGKTGPAGPAGPAGPQGPAGANGKDGANGSNGAAGASGESVANTAVPTSSATCNHLGGAEFKVGAGASTTACNGKAGQAGQDGAPGAPGPAGPPGPTCDPSGACLLPPGATETGVWAASTGKGALNFFAPISFPLRLRSSEIATFGYHYVTPANPAAADCPGSKASPKALPGNLCLYPGLTYNISEPPSLAGDDPTSGVILASFIENEEEEALSNGSWAVTACPEGGCS